MVFDGGFVVPDAEGCLPEVAVVISAVVGGTTEI